MKSASIATGSRTVQASNEVLDLCVKNLSLSYGRDSKILQNVNLNVAGGKTLALLGPSGCGKTSLLRAISGLQIPSSGKISVGSRILFDSENAVNLKPERRQVGMVFQDLALFPHFSVGENVAYGIAKNVGSIAKNNINKNSARKETRSNLVAKALALVGLSGFENRRISTLSGGQQQRIALARALAHQPRVLLLDEPFASLDEPTRVGLRKQIHQLLSELLITTVFVTHNQEEAFILGDEVAVLGTKGVIEQQDTPFNLYTKPLSPWVADFVGSMNLISGISDGAQAKTALGKIPLQDPVPPAGTEISVLTRPENFILTEDTAAEIKAEIELKEYYGHDTLYLLAAPGWKNPVSVRSAVHIPEYERGTRVGIKYAGPAAISFPSK